jgi:hypothetical protein
MKLNRDFKEFLSLLNSNDVHYLIVGGYALGAHGHVRYTKDLDIWVEAVDENAAKLVSVLTQFGFESLSISKADFTTPGLTMQLGYEPARIDLLTRVSGLKFDSAYRRRIDTTLDGVPITLICREDLRQNKLATGRLRDLGDVEALGYPIDTRNTKSE